MSRSKFIFVFVVFFSVAFCQVPPMFTVQGINGTSANFSAADLARLPQQTVKTTDHGTPVTFQGVLLTDVLAKVDLRTGGEFHSTAASYSLTVEGQGRLAGRVRMGRTGFETFMEKAVYVVTIRDGKPLSDKDRPFELVWTPGEKRNARWVRQLTALKIRQAN